MKKMIVAVVVALSLLVTVGGDALAKAGKNSSMGSRGSRTEDRPIERSLTPQPPAAKAAPVAPVQQQPLTNPQTAPMMQPQAAMGAAAMQQPSFFQRNPFVTGMLGGLVGAGIGSMLFGGSSAMAAANEAAPMAGMLGTFLQIALIAGLGWMLFRMFRRKTQPQSQEYGREAYGSMDRSASSPQPSLSVPSAAPRVEREFEAAAGDFDTFTAIVTGVQKAWSEGDLVSLRKLATLEVVGWMSEDLAADQSRGVRNVVEDVTLQSGDVTESWREDGREYLTARISFSCRDYMVRLDNAQVVEGDPQKLVTHTELWTFLRSGNNGQWLLTAIEQV